MHYSIISEIKKISITYMSLGFIFLLGCKKSEEVKKPVNKAPNILFILTDDQRWDAIGYSGNKLAYTPEMDKLAKQGLFFKNTISTTPICSASRASIFSGLYERTHGYSFSSVEMKEEFMQSAFPRILKQSGYHTGLFGKFGVKYKALDSLYDTYETYDLRYHRKDISSYYYKKLNNETVHLTRYTGEKGIQFIKEAPKDKPFCLQLSFSAPHASDNTEEQYFWQKENDHILENTVIPIAEISSDEHYGLLPEIVKKGYNRRRWFWRYDTSEKYQQNIKGYYRMIAGIDNEIGKLRQELERKGIADNTVIILMGDNGFFLGERQITGKWLLYENSIKIPLVIYDPRNKNHMDIDNVALNIDIPATILDYANIKAPEHWHGMSLKPDVTSKTVGKPRDTILIEHIWNFKNIPASEGVRTHEWKYFRYVENKSIEELYNLKEDPHEINNLAKDLYYQTTLNNLRSKCDALIDTYEDPTAFDLEPKVSSLSTNPRFSWDFDVTIHEQLAYQILISSSKKKCANNIGDVWDSHKVISDKTQGINFNGAKLISNQTYYYKLRLWDELNRIGEYTDVKKFVFNNTP